MQVREPEDHVVEPSPAVRLQERGLFNPHSLVFIRGGSHFLGVALTPPLPSLLTLLLVHTPALLLPPGDHRAAACQVDMTVAWRNRNDSPGSGRYRPTFSLGNMSSMLPAAPLRVTPGCFTSRQTSGPPSLALRGLHVSGQPRANLCRRHLPCWRRHTASLFSRSSHHMCKPYVDSTLRAYEFPAYTC